MEQNGIATGNWQAFLTLNGERLLMVVRKHPFVIILPILATTTLSVFLLISGWAFFERFFSSIPLLITSSLLLLSITVGVIAKMIIDWYFHVYVLTNRKILEFRYTPLTSYVVNDIMLDRVSCTEVDFQTTGLLHDLIDLGDVMITFDRPTHQEEFVLRDIQHCNRVGNFLARQLLDGSAQDTITPIWFSGHSWGKR